MSQKIKCALIGPGNIGTDLLAKLQRSPVLEPVWMVGIDPESDGLKRAREMGLKTTAEGVDGLLPHVLADGVQIAFDATSAYVHAENSRKLNELGVLMIDLTPAAIGPFCVPPVNLLEHVGKGEMNVNMVTCGGQATIPMVAAVSRVQNDYLPCAGCRRYRGRGRARAYSRCAQQQCRAGHGSQQVFFPYQQHHSHPSVRESLCAALPL